MKYFKYLLFLIFITGIQQVQAQNWRLVMDIVVTDEGKKMPGAEIQLIKNGKLSETLKTDNKGKVEVPLLPDAVYVISISGPGYINKKLEIDTRNVNPEDIGSGDIIYPAEVDIFKKIEGLNLNILEEPIGKIWYDDNFGGFTYNKDYTLQRQAALKTLKEDYIKKKEEELNSEVKSKELYAEAIKKGDKAFKAENWEEAKAEYEKAQALDPFESYPTDQLGAIASKQVQKGADEENYKAAIMKADAALKSKNYKNAISEYQKAIVYKPNDKYALDKIAEAQLMATNAAKLEQNYLSAIEQGDNFLMANKLEEAKVAFEEAKQLKPSESYPKTKLSEINSILAKSSQVQTDYQNAVKEGDAAFAASNFSNAKLAYNKAIGLKPTENYPKEQLTKIEEVQAEAAKKEQEYLAAIEEADNSLSSKNYEEAIKSFELASQIKPEEAYPKDKLKEIKDFLANNAKKEQEYQTAISTADAALASQKYAEAKSSYQKALSIKTSETYPQEKISEINTLLNKQAEEDEKYQLAIAAGDKALASKDYASAKASYGQANSLKPSESYPKDKLEEIVKLEAELNKLDENYTAAINMADDAFAAKKFEEAIEFYQQASALKTNEAYPKQRISEAQNKIAAAEKAVEEYLLAIKEADKALSSKNLTLAKTEYKKALSLKPNEKYPSEKLSEIDRLLAENQAKEQQFKDAITAADEAYASKNWKEAEKFYQSALKINSEDTYTKGKLEEVSSILAEQAANQNKYNEAITSADKALINKDYEAARKAYEEAKKLKVNETYPSEKIAEIDQLLSKLAEEKEAIRLENERKAKLEQDYISAISEADRQFDEKAYDKAKIKYEEALSLKSNEEYPIKRISEIDEIKQKELSQMKEAELNASYQKAISQADKAFSSKDYIIAKSSYKAALEVKPEKSYPMEKLEEIKKVEQQIALEEEKKAEAEKAAEIQSKYDAAVLAADNALASLNLELAKNKYQSALEIKPNERYPKEKIEEINTQISNAQQEHEAEQLAMEKAAKLETEYLAAISIADEALSSEDFSTAKNNYAQALQLKPNENYPKNKIDEINAYLVQQAAKDSERAAALDAEKTKVENEYNSLIASADEKFQNKAYREAIADYQAAAKVKPTEKYPRNKVDEINNLLKESLAKEEGIRLEKERQAKKEIAYQEAISVADKHFQSQDWDKAKTAYTKAAELQPENEYPKVQLELVQSRILEKQSKLSETAKKQEQVEKDLMYTTLIKNADISFDENEYQLAKRDYEEALSIKPDETYPKEQLERIENKLEEIELLTQKKQEEKKEENTEEILVQSGEKSSIDSETEDKVDRLYQEMWSEKKESKESYFSSRKEEQEKKDKELKKLEEEKKLNAIERLEKISISYEESQAQAIKLNTQNHQNVQNIQKRVNEASENREHNSQKQRERFYSNQQDLQKNINENNRRNAEVHQKLNYYGDANDSQTDFQKDMSSEHQQAQSNAVERIIQVEEYKARKVNEHQQYISNKAEQLAARKQEILEMEQERKNASEERRQVASSQEYNQENRYLQSQQQSQTNSMQEIEAQKEYHKQKQASQNAAIKSRSENLAQRKQELQEMEEKRKKSAESRMQEAVVDDYETYDKKYVENQNQAQANANSLIEAQIKFQQEKQANQLAVVKKKSELLVERKKELEEMEAQRRNAAEERALEGAQQEYSMDEAKFSNNQEKIQSDNISRIEAMEQRKQEVENRHMNNISENAERLKQRKAELMEMEGRRMKSSEQLRSNNNQTEYYQGEAKNRKDEMSSKYPQGISEQVIENKNNSTTIRRDHKWIFMKKHYMLGVVYFLPKTVIISLKMLGTGKPINRQ